MGSTQIWCQIAVLSINEFQQRLLNIINMVYDGFQLKCFSAEEKHFSWGKSMMSLLQHTKTFLTAWWWPLQFQHDCTPAQEAKSIRTWMSGLGKENLAWPAQCPIFSAWPQNCCPGRMVKYSFKNTEALWTKKRWSCYSSKKSGPLLWPQLRTTHKDWTIVRVYVYKDNNLSDFGI